MSVPGILQLGDVTAMMKSAYAIEASIVYKIPRPRKMTLERCREYSYGGPYYHNPAYHEARSTISLRMRETTNVTYQRQLCRADSYNEEERRCVLRLN